MISFLLMSLVSWAPCDAPRSVTFEAANVASLRVEALARLDAVNDPLASTIEVLRPEMARGDETVTLADLATAPEMEMLQAGGGGNGCVRTGNFVMTVILNGADPVPVVNVAVLPFTCPDGTVVQREVKHSVWYRSGVKRWTYEKASPQAGVACPPDVLDVPFTEVAIENWTYDDEPVCPNACCIVRSTESRLEYNFPLTACGTWSSEAGMKCPNGTPGTRTTTTSVFCKQFRWVTRETYDSKCPGVACEDILTEGPWAAVEWKRIVTVTTNCGAAPI